MAGAAFDSAMRPALASALAQPLPPQVRPAATTALADPLVPTIFHEPWWLDLISHGSYREVRVHHHGRLVGRLPYVVSRRRLLPVSVMPELTHVLGPAVNEGNGSVNTRILRRIDIMKELAAQLPRLSLFSQFCHRGVSDVLAFQSCRFDTLVHFTCEVEPAPEPQLWAAMRDKTRNVIRRAEERERVEDLQDPDEFRAFYAANLADSGRRSYFDLDLIAPLYRACRARDQGRILVARNDLGKPVAAVFCVWDRATFWYLLSTRSRAEKDNGAVSMLVWHALREASRRGLLFDFDGVASEGAARFFAGFGGRIVPRYSIQRSSATYDLLKSAATWLRGSRRNYFTVP